MQLGWWMHDKSKLKYSLDVVPLKKIVAVSDEYWVALYEPIIFVVNRVINTFDKKSENLRKDFVNQLVNIVRRSKGAVQDDPLIVHLQTYSLVVAISALYIGRICNDFEFHSISLAKKNKGERKQYFPWLEVPANCELKIKKVIVTQPVYVTSLPVMNEMISAIGKEWLQANPAIVKQLLNAVYSNGEKGSLSVYSDDFQVMPFGGVGNETIIVASEDAVSTDEAVPSLDDLICDIGGEGNSQEVLLENLFDDENSATNKQPSEKDVVDERVSKLATDAPTDAPTGLTVEETLVESDEVTIDPLDEFQNLLNASKPKDNDCKVEADLPELDEGTLTYELFKWALDSLAKGEVTGLYGFMYHDVIHLAIDRCEGINAFVRADYDLDSEKDYAVVAEEVLTDLIISQAWLENEEGSDNWSVITDKGATDIILTKVKLLRDTSYVITVKE